MRTHVVLPEDLVNEIDDLVGKRKRSRFVEEAIREKLKKTAIADALRDTAGIVSEKNHPEWETSKQVAQWVRESRRLDMERLARPGRD